MKTDDKTAIKEQLKKKKDQIRQQSKKVELRLTSAELLKKNRKPF